MMMDTSCEAFKKLWQCLLCKIQNIHLKSYFTPYDNIDLENLYSKESMRMFETHSKFEVMAEISNCFSFSLKNVNVNVFTFKMAKIDFWLYNRQLWVKELQILHEYRFLCGLLIKQMKS